MQKFLLLIVILLVSMGVMRAAPRSKLGRIHSSEEGKSSSGEEGHDSDEDGKSSLTDSSLFRSSVAIETDLNGNRYEIINLGHVKVRKPVGSLVPVSANCVKCSICTKPSPCVMVSVGISFIIFFALILVLSNLK
jgi:hypothetical protein